jgi:hypothetical protein
MAASRIVVCGTTPEGAGGFGAATMCGGEFFMNNPVESEANRCVDSRRPTWDCERLR